MPDAKIVNYRSVTSGIGLDDAQQMVVLIFETKENVTVQIGLSGTGLRGLARTIQKLAADRPEVLDWQSEQRH